MFPFSALSTEREREREKEKDAKRHIEKYSNTKHQKKRCVIL